MVFLESISWHEGELAMHKRTGVGTRHENPTDPFLTPSAANMIQRYPMMAMGTLDDDDRLWCTVWSSDQVPIARLGTESILEVHTTVDASFDPVIRAIFEGKDNGDIRQVEGDGRLMAGLSIHLEERARVKFAGRVVAGAITASEASKDRGENKKDRGENKNDSNRGKVGEVDLVVNIEQSLSNCPKYINRKHVVAATPEPRLISSSARLTQKAVNLLHNADLFFIASAHNHDDMDVNYRGGSPGFVRVQQPADPDGSSTIVWPEYSGNNFYQTLGNLEVTPHAGLVIPDFDTGDVLYITGDTRILVGAAARKVIAKSTLAVSLQVRAARFVENGMPLRGRLMTDRSKGRSPYNPRIRYLTSERTEVFGEIAGHGPPTTAKLVRKTRLTPTITRYCFALADPSVFGPWKPGQYVAMDFSSELDMGYAHMREDDPTSLNDDYIRTITVSSVPGSLGVQGEEFEVTIREVGNVTRWLARQSEGTCEVGVRGFGGDFSFEPSKRNAFIAAGIGITPLLGQMKSIAPGELKVCWSLAIRDVGLAIDVFAQYPELKDSVAVFLTGAKALLGREEQKDKANMKTLTDIGVEVQNRRVEKGDLTPWLTEVDNWYICTKPTMRKQVQEWILGATIIYESFDY